MINQIFLWFYCLPIPRAIALVGIFTAAYLILKLCFGPSKVWRIASALFFLVSLVLIAAATLADRLPGSIPPEPELIPFHSYRAVMAGENRELLRSNLMNVILFYPAGLFACELLPGKWNKARKVLLMTALFAIASAGIEFCQYRFALGQAEIDDVIHNTFGALIGSAVSAIFSKK